MDNGGAGKRRAVVVPPRKACPPLLWGWVGEVGAPGGGIIPWNSPANSFSIP